LKSIASVLFTLAAVVVAIGLCWLVG